ncbi:MAG: aminotransferase class V-fold PLP-dependent enzyme [candidate division KSB1 bacterium]|nr:aminotransferase class V-fold PLP-dependent enzyme [candidate division KSB1 bacterium]
MNLDFDPETMRRMGELALQAVVDHLAQLPDAPRSNLDHAEEIVRALREGPPENGTEFEQLLRFIMHEVIPVSINTPHPSYLAYIPGGGLYPSALADFIASATNRFAGAWFAAPAASRLEANVLEWFAQWMDYPSSARGILTSGGSLANFSAIVAARKHHLGDDLCQGTIYMSNQTHHSLIKAAMLAGIPEKNIRLLPVGDRFKAIPETFEQAIEQDRKNGLRPFMLIGNAGTTNTGAIDPLEALADIARKHQLWFHVDGAYGGFFRLTDEGRQKLCGIEQSDSVVLDPHKGLFVPYGTGSLVVKEGERLRRAHMLEAEYLQDHDVPEGEVNPADYSPELSRFYRGLRVWLPLKLYGVRAFRAALQEKLDLARELYQKFKQEPGFEVLNEPELTVTAFRYRPPHGDIDAFNRQLLQAINRSKKLFLASTLLNGQFVIRTCVLSFRTHRPEIEAAFEVIRYYAHKLASQM